MPEKPTYEELEQRIQELEQPELKTKFLESEGRPVGHYDAVYCIGIPVSLFSA